MGALQYLYEGLLRDFPKDPSIRESIEERAAQRQSDAEVQLFMEAVDLPSIEDENFFKNLKRLHTTLSTKDSLIDVPKGLEARRRISFFSNSLFMTMPRAPQVVPHYLGQTIYISLTM